MILRYVGSDLFLRSTYSYLCIIISARMKKTHLLIALAPLMGACAVNTGQVEVTVENPATASPETAIVELPASDILGRLGSDCFVVTDSEGRELCSQLTHDSLIIFEAAVAPGAKATYYVAASDTMPTYAPVAVGRLYPERADDLAWENDLVGFRAYGPATQAKGERAFGYDIFMKHYSAEPVLERLYEPETSPAVWAKVDSLRAIDPVLAEDFIKTFSYHIDHGLGMDCYAVGPTLGAGVAVPLLEGDSLSYSWCYDKATAPWWSIAVSASTKARSLTAHLCGTTVLALISTSWPASLCAIIPPLCRATTFLRWPILHRVTITARHFSE